MVEETFISLLQFFCRLMPEFFSIYMRSSVSCIKEKMMNNIRLIDEKKCCKDSIVLKPGVGCGLLIINQFNIQ